jgi:hypothetical protein
VKEEKQFESKWIWKEIDKKGRWVEEIRLGVCKEGFTAGKIWIPKRDSEVEDLRSTKLLQGIKISGEVTKYKDCVVKEDLGKEGDN